jgi:transmembrane sensor
MARLERVAFVGGDALRPKKGAKAAVAPVSMPIWTRRRVAMAGGIAAGLAALGIVGPAFRTDHEPEVFATKIGEVHVVPLPDGSVLTLNTNTRLLVDYTEAARNIELSQGEALFQVAKDKRRPFTVSSGDTQVVAVGTSFVVRALPARPIQVLVKEGVVEVRRTGSLHAAARRVVANTRTLVPASSPIVTRPLPPERLARNLAWEAGLIAFDNEPLGSAAEEFARYSDTRIVVDSVVADRGVTGIFASNNPVGFARATAKALKLNVEVSAEEVRISR